MITDDRASVPCNGCKACCRGDAIMLLPDEGDDVASYDHEIVTLAPGLTGPILKHKDGHCIYLGDNGCTIWDRAPKICRVFDCRRLFLSKTRIERRQLVKRGISSKAIFEAGRARLNTL